MSASKAQLASRIKNQLLTEVLEELNRNHLLHSTLNYNMVNFIGADWHNPSRIGKPQQIEIKTDKGSFLIKIEVEHKA